MDAQALLEKLRQRNSNEAAQSSSSSPNPNRTSTCSSTSHPPPSSLPVSSSHPPSLSSFSSSASSQAAANITLPFSSTELNEDTYTENDLMFNSPSIVSHDIDVVFTPPLLSANFEGLSLPSSSSSSSNSSSSTSFLVSPDKLNSLKRKLQSFNQSDCHYTYNTLTKDRNIIQQKKKRKALNFSPSNLWVKLGPEFFDHSLVMMDIEKNGDKTYKYKGIPLYFDSCHDFREYNYGHTSKLNFLFHITYIYIINVL
jgi:hypothetical protein